MNLSDKPLVSICVATYNGERYIKEQIDSLLQQSYKNIEIIVQDDCSSDMTVDILREYSDKIKLFVNEKNLGYIKNFESLIQRANGDFIALCDQDDIWETNKLELLLTNIDSNTLIYSNSLLIDANGNSLNITLKDKLRNNFISSTTALNFLFDNSVSAHAMLFKRELLPLIRQFPKTCYFDQYIAATAASLRGVVYLDKELVQYRQHANNTLGNRPKNKHSILQKIQKKLQKKEEANRQTQLIIKEFLTIPSLSPDEEEILQKIYTITKAWSLSWFNINALQFYLKFKNILFSITTQNKVKLSVKKSIGYKFYQYLPFL